jgi:hypothetical protein
VLRCIIAEKGGHLFIKTRLSGFLWMVILFIAYPLCLVSDRLFGVSDKRYMLMAEGKKINSFKKALNLKLCHQKGYITRFL